MTLAETIAGISLGLVAFIYFAFNFDDRPIRHWLRKRTERIRRKVQHFAAEWARWDMGAVVNVILGLVFLALVWHNFYAGLKP